MGAGLEAGGEAAAAVVLAGAGAGELAAMDWAGDAAGDVAALAAGEAVAGEVDALGCGAFAAGDADDAGLVAGDGDGLCSSDGARLPMFERSGPILSFPRSAGRSKM